MDPVLQTFQQQGSGSAEGQGFGNFFIQGRQLNLSQQHLELAKKAEARAKAEQDALLPLQKQLMEYKAIQDGVALGTVATQAQAGIASGVIIPQVNELAGQFADAPDGYANTELRKKASELMTRNPWAFTAGEGAKIKQGIQAFTMERTKHVMELAHDATIQDAAEAAKDGYNYTEPGDRLAWRKKKALREMEAQAEKRGQMLVASKLLPGWFDENTGHLDPEMALQSLEQMPRSSLIQSREDIAYQKIQAQMDLLDLKLRLGGGYTPGAVEKDIKFYEQQFQDGKITQEELDHARRQRMFLEAKPSTTKETSMADYVNKHIDHLMSQSVGLKREQAQTILEKEWQKYYGATAPHSGGKVLNYDPVTNTLK